MVIIPILVLITAIILYWYLYVTKQHIIKLTPDEHNLLSKKKFDRYQLKSFLVRGDFNTTFLALDPMNNKTVIVRVLHHRFANRDNIVQQFFFKCEMLKFLSDRFIDGNFIQNISYGTAYIDDEPRPYIVTDYLVGVSLAQVLAVHQQLSYRDAFSIITQIAKSVTLAHSQRIWMRELTPVNIILRVDNSGKLVATLANIGVAFGKLPDEESAKFKEPYYSPEDRRGEDVDERSDVYALASLLFRMVGGHDLTNIKVDESLGDLSFLEPSLKDDPRSRTATVDEFLKSINLLSTQPSHTADLKWDEIISQILNKHKELQTKPSKRTKLGRTTHKPDIIPVFTKGTKKRHTLSFVTGLLSTFVLWIGRKVEKILASPKRAIKFSVIGLFAIIAALWFLVFSPSKAKLSIYVTPPDATVVLDLKDTIPPTRFSDYETTPGKHRICIFHRACISQEYDTTLNKGQNDFSFALVSLPPQLYITANAQASVFIDNKLRGSVPYTEYSLPIGKHNVKISAQGYFDTLFTVDVRQGKTDTIDLALVTGISLTITTQPDSATVYINNKEVGVTPLNRQLSIAEHQIKIKKENYTDVDSLLTILPNEKYSLNIQLAPSYGKLTLDVIPKGIIEIDDSVKEKERNIRYRKDLAAGKHKVKVTHGQYSARWEKEIQIAENDSQNIVINFDAKYSLEIEAYDDAGRELIAEIYVDGKLYGSTPKKITVPCCYHEIDVRKTGYVNTGGIRRMNIEKDYSKPIKFTLKKSVR